MRATLILRREDVYRAGYRSFVVRLKDRVSDMREGWTGVMKVLFENEVRVFQQEGRTDEHGPWAQLRPGYLAWKETNFPGRPILRLTRKLIAQLTGASGDHHEVRGRIHLEFGTDYPAPGSNRDLGGILAEGREGEMAGEAELTGGISGGWGRNTAMAPRPPIRITEGTITDIVDAILDYAIGTD